MDMDVDMPMEIDEPDENLPEDFDELPDIIEEDSNSTNANQPQRLDYAFVEPFPPNKRNEIVVWDIPHEEIPPDARSNIANTQQAIEEYFLRARKNRTRSTSFLERYYQFATPPEIGQRLTLREYCLFKSRINCDRNGVRIPRMDAECQRMIYQHLLEEITETWRRRHGIYLEPLPPQAFRPYFNPETMSYEAR